MNRITKMAALAATAGALFATAAPASAAAPEVCIDLLEREIVCVCVSPTYCYGTLPR